MPKRLLFKPSSMYKTRCAPGYVEVTAAKIDSKTIAAKIDEISGKDISDVSEQGRVYAKENNWGMLLHKYQEFFYEVHNEENV